MERLRRQRASEVQKATLCQALFRALICRRIMRKKIRAEKEMQRTTSKERTEAIKAGSAATRSG